MSAKVIRFPRNRTYPKIREPLVFRDGMRWGVRMYRDDGHVAELRGVDRDQLAEIAQAIALALKTDL